jgi:hypothetical protein
VKSPKLAPAAAASPTPEIAYTEVQLPSRGLLYGPEAVIKTPALPEGRVQIRKMLIAEDEILAGSGGTALTRLSKVLARTTKLPQGFDPEHLLVQDRMFLLLTVRTHTFGPHYEIAFRCPHCRANNAKRSINVVEALNEKPLNPDVREPIDVLLPDAGCRVGIRLARGLDEQALVRAAREAESRGQTGTPLQDQFRQIIVTIDNEPVANPLQRLDLIRRFSSADVLAIRKAQDAVEFGVDTTIYPNCEKCEAAVELDMPFGADFFRPATS